MASTWKDEICFFPGENPDELRAEFIHVQVNYPSFTAFDAAQHVFRNLKEPKLRADQAASIWIVDIEVQEAIRLGKLQPRPSLPGDDPKKTAIDTLIVIYQNVHHDAKDRVKAIEVLAKIHQWGGYGADSTDVKIVNSAELIAEIGKAVQA